MGGLVAAAERRVAVKKGKNSTVKLEASD